MKSYVVYMHTTPNNKKYIGITSKNPIKRWGCNGNRYKTQFFYKAIQKYGWDNIEHKILFANLSKKEAEQKEIELIKKYKSNQKEYGYNVENGGNSNGKHSEETKLKIAKANKGRKPWDYGIGHNETTKHKISIANKGKKRSAEAIEKMSKAKLGKKQSKETIIKIANANRGKKRSIETRKKISKTMSHPVLCVETNTVYYGVREAERNTNISSGSISKCCNGKQKQAGGYHWKYL